MPTSGRLRLFAKYAFERTCVLRSLKVALVVGTVLALINHIDSIVSGSAGTTVIFQILLTYAVPYSVSTFGSAMQGIQMERGGHERGLSSAHAPADFEGVKPKAAVSQYDSRGARR